MTTKQRTKTAHSENGRLQEFQQDLEHKAVNVIGGVVTFHPGGEKPMTDVVAALTAAGLDPKVCRDTLPRHAFARAAHKLAEDGSVDHTRETQDEVGFQFTRKALANDEEGEKEWQFSKECVIWVNKDTGRVHCQLPKRLEHDADATARARELGTKAAKLVRHHMEVKSVTDITSMVRKQFEAQALKSTGLGLCPLPDSDRAYLVLQEEFAFLDQIRRFMKELGGRLNFLPVPGGTREAEQTVADSVAAKFEAMAREHEATVQAFGVGTRQKTIEEQAEYVKQSRSKLKSHLHLLGEHAKLLEETIDKCDEVLAERVKELVEERKNRPVGESGGPTQRSLIEDALKEGKYTIEEIAKKSGSNVGRVKSHFYWMKQHDMTVSVDGAGRCSWNGTKE